MVTEKISKGVKFCCETTDRFKTSIISFHMAMPLSGAISARAVLPFLLCRTNSKYPTVTALNKKLASLYGAQLRPSVNKIGEVQILSLTVTAIDDRFSLHQESIGRGCMELLCDCVFHPVTDGKSFLTSDIQREKKLLIEKIESEKDDKRLYSNRRCEEEMCKDESYGQSPRGTVEQIEKLTEKEIFDAWLDVLLHSCIQINMISSAPVDEAVDFLKEIFKPLNRKEIVELKTEFLTHAYESKTIIEQQTIKQSKMVIGMRAGMTYDMDNLGAIILMNDIFGGNVYSKLFTQVREKQSLCYYCWSRLNRYKGIILIQCGVETENIEKALSSIHSQLELMRKGEFDEEVVKNAKAALKDLYLSTYDSPEDLDRWFTNSMVSSSYLSPSDMANLFEEVSKEEIILAAMEISEDTIFILQPKEGEQNEGN